jgi:hypothetical protein
MDEQTQTLIEGINKGVGERLDTFNSDMTSKFDAKLAEIDERIKPPEVEDNGEDAEVAKEGAVEGIAKMKVWDVPLGEGLLGGGMAVFASELVDGFFASQSSTTLGFIKLVASGVIVKWGGKLLGSTGSKAAAVILAYDGIRQIVPLDEWVGNLVGGITDRTGGGLAGKAGMNPPVTRVVPTAPSGDYYAGLWGGAR